MMKINPLASSSEGNAYVLSDGETSILLECGIPYSELQKKTGFTISHMNACLISHSHGDHALSVNEVAGTGIDCYMSKETKSELKIKDNVIHRIHEIENEKLFIIGTFTVLPLEMHHDVKCYGFLINSNVTHEWLLFATDTSHISYKLKNLDYIMIEANYDLNILNKRIMSGDIDKSAKYRLVNSHQSIDTCIKYLSKIDLRKCKRIYLMHLSGRSACAYDFKMRVMSATGKPVTIC